MTHYRVAWVSKLTGLQGHGSWFSDRSLVQRIVNDANERYPECEHVLEESLEEH